MENNTLTQMWDTRPPRIPENQGGKAVIGGVCEGIGARFHIDPTFVRVVFVALSLAFGGGIAATFALGFAVSRWRGRRVAQAGIEGLDASYGNVGFMGIPLCLLVFGPDSLPAAVVATLFTACVLFLFAVALIEAELRGGAGFGRATGRDRLAALGFRVAFALAFTF